MTRAGSLYVWAFVCWELSGELDLLGYRIHGWPVRRSDDWKVAIQVIAKLAKAWLLFLVWVAVFVFVAIAVFLIGFLIYATVKGEPGIWPIDIAFAALILTVLSLMALGEW